MQPDREQANHDDLQNEAKKARRLSQHINEQIMVGVPETLICEIPSLI